MVKDIHCLIDLVDRQATMDLFHGLAGVLHGVQCFLVDIRSFDGIYLLFDLGSLCGSLLELLFIDLLSS